MSSLTLRLVVDVVIHFFVVRKLPNTLINEHKKMKKLFSLLPFHPNALTNNSCRLRRNNMELNKRKRPGDTTPNSQLLARVMEKSSRRSEKKNEKWKVQVNNNCSRDCILTSNGVEWRKEEEIRCSIAPRSLITCMICCVWSRTTQWEITYISRETSSRRRRRWWRRASEKMRNEMGKEKKKIASNPASKAVIYSESWWGCWVRLKRSQIIVRNLEISWFKAWKFHDSGLFRESRIKQAKREVILGRRESLIFSISL